MIGKIGAVVAAFVIGLVLYLLLGETGLVTWHKNEGMRSAFSSEAPAPAASTSAPKEKSRPAMLLNSFESKKECFVGVDGYTEVERSSQKVSHGDFSLKATFLLRSQFYSTPTPEATPYLQPGSLTPTATPTSTPVWRPRILIGMGSATGLRTQDFSPYRALRLDVFNPEQRAINGQLELADSRGYTFVLPAVGLVGQKVTTLGADLADLAAQDLDLKHIRHLAFHVDVSGRGSPPVLYLDNLRLEP